MNDTEKKIARHLVKHLLDGGHTLRVWDGEEFTTPNQLTSVDEVMKDLASTDMDKLFVHMGNNRLGWVLLVWGNGEDLISDYTISLEPVMEPVCAWVEEQVAA